MSLSQKLSKVSQSLRRLAVKGKELQLEMRESVEPELVKPTKKDLVDHKQSLVRIVGETKAACATVKTVADACELWKSLQQIAPLCAGEEKDGFEYQFLGDQNVNIIAKCKQLDEAVMVDDVEMDYCVVGLVVVAGMTPKVDMKVYYRWGERFPFKAVGTWSYQRMNVTVGGTPT